jgi:glycosyltransferase involved in cell wall biosynthesis
MPEIVGKSGLLVNPRSIDSIYQGINKLLSSASLRGQLSDSAKAIAGKFSWDKTALQTLEIYSKLK